MNRLTLALAGALVATAFFAVPSMAADDEDLKKDLTAVIALNGQPCGQVIAVKVRAENDYDASCKDGNQYHVYMNKAGRVVVEKAK
ncbi:MAG: hypothetical protein ABIV06_01515 [Thermoanaerobaculia bacterium]